MTFTPVCPACSHSTYATVGAEEVGLGVGTRCYTKLDFSDPLIFFHLFCFFFLTDYLRYVGAIFVLENCVD